MSKYRIGDKFEIEIAEILSDCMGEQEKYLIKGFSTLVFDNFGLDRLGRIESAELEIDWSKVPVDTPILVKNTIKSAWNKRYFAKYENGKVYAWLDGATSWAADGLISWEYTKLAEVEHEQNIKTN